MPARRVHPALFLFFVLPAAVPILFAGPFLRFFRQSNTPDVVSSIFLGFLVIAFGVLPVVSGLRAFLKNRLGRTTVTASTSGIRVEERRLWKTRLVRSLDAADIVDVDYSVSGTLLTSVGHGMARPVVDPRAQRVLTAISRFAGRNAVTIKSRRDFTRFGEGLEDDEIRYLHSIVRRAIVDGRVP